MKLWKLCVLIYRWNCYLSETMRLSNYSSVWGFLFLISSYDWKTKLGIKYWYKRYLASCLMSNLLVTFLIAYNLISLGKLLLSYVIIFWKSMFSLSYNLLRGLFPSLLMYLGDIYNLRLIALHKAWTFLSVLAALDHLTLLGYDIFVSNMNPLSNNTLWITF